MISTVDSVVAPTFAEASLPTAVPDSAQTIEQQINALTWSVLDGTASPADRQRLAELVRTQHASRRRAG